MVTETTITQSNIDELKDRLEKGWNLIHEWKEQAKGANEIYDRKRKKVINIEQQENNWIELLHDYEEAENALRNNI